LMEIFFLEAKKMVNLNSLTAILVLAGTKKLPVVLFK
jgi:hypothetical protein